MMKSETLFPKLGLSMRKKFKNLISPKLEDNLLGTAMSKHAPCMQLKQYIASKLTYSEAVDSVISKPVTWNSSKHNKLIQGKAECQT
ncbi:hypothetical protein QL285_007273 [Trifolium repens]|nr:hypothetical protein QL285_007273 [Trifolium repens]